MPQTNVRARLESLALCVVEKLYQVHYNQFNPERFFLMVEAFG